MHTSLLLSVLSIAASVHGSPLHLRQNPDPASTAPSVPNPTLSPDLLKDLAQQPTVVDRFTQLLNTDPELAPLKFDFNPSANPPFRSPGGGSILATRRNFAPLVDLSISSAMGFMAPCSINTAHTHPRAAEFLTVVSGQVESGFILENGLPTQFNTTLTRFQGTVYPMGSIHFQLNNQCEDAVFVAGLGSDDPGTSTIAQNFFRLGQDLIQATLGFPEAISSDNFQAFRDQIPASFARGVEECLQRCGLPL